LDIKDFSYNHFRFRNNWKNYKTTCDQYAESLELLFKSNDNLITKFINFSIDRNQLIEINNHLNLQNERRFEIYTDGSVCDFGKEQCVISFGFIILMDNQLLHKFRSEISYFPSSNKAELLAVISALIVLPNHSEITIYTDSNNVITEYYNIIDRNNFDISPRKFFKINSNNIFWNILCEIIVIKSLIIDFIKVKGHSDNYYNNYIDEYISYTDETSGLVF